MDLALSMLSDGDFRVSDVAEQLGYADVFTFSKQFKQIYKKSPKNFRQSDPILDSDWSM
jgi:AraC-like DNA-binding protein